MCVSKGRDLYMKILGVVWLMFMVNIFLYKQPSCLHWDLGQKQAIPLQVIRLQFVLTEATKAEVWKGRQKLKKEKVISVSIKVTIFLYKWKI